jgi:hypothetical protein
MHIEIQATIDGAYANKIGSLGEVDIYFSKEKENLYFVEGNEVKAIIFFHTSITRGTIDEAVFRTVPPD